ncbi:Aldehyde:ferredoxin oxidoreductase [Halanaeroarchaeum sp. HSR-CO]|uniref:aldehyde ferredoxin oxidoreductase family protein n=1 Tax=Halanaeroarchaeum sp. HSR-CO TaxID=2866382 RepID=UPI00217DB704|nr:aldehyde ferredoxin oxidoreductase C-terminal domain-containing protein [Halanaeroarchaeum sp. HSR-CO]UWG47092.1 Aldehyde:ferredoxin oxidoreductase [Halanaeroarchaeum sp. HSR-CO]
MLHTRGPLLSIDVGEQTSHTEDIGDILEEFIGGRGLNTKLAHDRIPFDADPLGRDNRLFFSTGPLQTSTMSFTGRMSATGLSPLTTGLLSSNAGGFLSRNFAATGYAAVEVTGKSDELVAIHITDDEIRFEPVPQLREAKISDVTDYMEKTHGVGPDQILAIGPAGENQVRFASIMTSESRAFGRGGLGALMGSKNVKAVTFDGDSTPTVEHPAPDTLKSVTQDAATSDSLMKTQGTTSLTDMANEMGFFPSRYFENTSFDGYEKINGDVVESKKYKKATCSQCAFACKLPTRDEESGVETEGPEFETVMSFGGNPEVDDIVSIMKSNELCDELGMDTISAGNTVSAYIAAEDEWGNGDLVNELTEKIAYREEEGDLLAEGVHRVHEELGVDDWTVKGMSFSAHDGRFANGQGLSFATANRGADHMYSTFYAFEYPLVDKELAVDNEGLEGKPPLIVEQEALRAVEDSGVVCRFSRGIVTMQKDRLEAIFDRDYDQLVDIGEQIVTLERHFNNERGFDREDDRVPYDLPKFEAALDEYYEAHGWNDDGTVPEELVA